MSSKRTTRKAKPRQGETGHGKTKRKRQAPKQAMPTLEGNAAGIDVGAREMYVAVPPDRDPEPVRVFPTFVC